jgi:hypothetical protein
MSMLEADYERTVNAAISAAKRYLAALASGEKPGNLIDLAMDARDRWATVEMVCALGEDAAHNRIRELPWRHYRQASRIAWLEARQWAVRAEDASARCQMAGALIQAHRGEEPAQPMSPRSLHSV